MLRQLSKIFFLVILSNSLLFSSCRAADGFTLLNNLLKAATPKNTTVNNVANQTTVATHITPTIVYSGYSKDFLTIKNLIISEQWEHAYKLQETKIQNSSIPEFLDSNEAGLLALDTKSIPNAIKHFADAEHYLKINAEKSFLEEGFLSFVTEASSLATGIGDLTEYRGAPFERILMLNYKSIAYLLNGERKVYNVTRRAIDWQNIEQKEFEKTIQSAKKQNQENEKELNKKISSNNTDANSTENNRIDTSSIFKVISAQYKNSEKSALSLSSAYVNPFGFYMAGIVQEFDSLEDSFSRDNAKISYNKALKLNPRSKILKYAVKEIKKRPPRGKRLVQVVVADGFAPERKMLQLGIPMPGGIVPIKLSIYQPVASKVAHIRIKSGKKTLATLSTVADIEAIVLRHQLDSLPLEHFKVVAAIARSTAENIVWGSLGAFGQIGKNFRESFAAPDMRAWMALPKRLLAARFYSSKRLKHVTVVSYDKHWRRLATKKVTLPKNKHSFIYARTIDNILNTNVNKTLWMNIK